MSIINFKELSIEDKNILDPFFNSTYHENAHLSFTNIFMWRKPYNIMWCIEDDILYMKANYDGHEFALRPLGPKGRLFEAIDKLKAYFTTKGLRLSLHGLEADVVEELQQYPGGEFEFVTKRDDDDYVYNSADLINLSGRKFHSKKNHLNNFRKNYPEVEYLPINEDIITQCKLCINGWYKQRLALTPDDPFIGYERDAIIEVLNHFEQLKLKGGALYDGQKVLAFTFGELLNENMAVIHVEKAAPDVNGAYTAINQGFVADAWKDVEFINREEDMGIPGLRKAKESYRPIKLVQKYKAKLKQ